VIAFAVAMKTAAGGGQQAPQLGRKIRCHA